MTQTQLWDTPTAEGTALQAVERDKAFEIVMKNYNDYSDSKKYKPITTEELVLLQTTWNTNGVSYLIGTNRKDRMTYEVFYSHDVEKQPTLTIYKRLVRKTLSKKVA